MGSSQSKVSVAVPNKTRCFPTYSEETLMQTIEKIEECHLEAIQIASWIGSLMSASSGPNHLLFSAGTVLFTFLLHRLSPTHANANEKCANLQSESAGNYPSKPTGSGSSQSTKDKTLEEALIAAKVSSAIASKSVCELQAKMYVVRNRNNRLLSNISPSDRRLEVVPAIQTCEEVLHLFNDSSHVFRMHPLLTAPLLVPFSAIFVSVAEISIVLIPSYLDHLLKQMDLLMDTLQEYKASCIKARLDSIKLKYVHPPTMMGVVATNERNYRMVDTCLPCSNQCTSDAEKDLERIYDDANVAMAVFREELETEFDKFFSPALETISKFSGYFQDFDDENDLKKSSEDESE